MEPIKKLTYCVNDIPSCCVNPIITWIDQPGVFIACPPNSKCAEISYIQPAPGQTVCVKLFVQCNNCGVNQILERDICFCGDGVSCGPCQDCGPNGVCVDRCPGKICDPVTNSCKECDDQNPCPGNKVCVAGGCTCPPDKPYDLGGNRCAECVGQAECEAKYGKCYVCQDGTCVYKGSCGGNGVCDPRTGNCEECVTAGDCSHKGDNFCCSAGKKCVCCSGYVLNPVTGKCDPQPECGPDRPCGPCSECIGGRCVRRQCPDGKICVNDNCVEKCDCNKPSSCSKPTDICRKVNGVCICESCGEGCTGAGCKEGCHCEGTKCVVDKCSGDCENGAGCNGGSGSSTGCGCLDNTCTDCSKLSCATGECARALGCECRGNVCESTRTRCVGSCNTKGECGDGCTCYQGKCVPCEFFSCANGDCSKQDGCRCNGTKCEKDPDYKCKDTLEIVKFDDSCDIEGQLTKDGGCACPVISTLLTSTLISSNPGANQTSGTHTIGFTSKLYLGNNIGDDNWLLDKTTNPEISINETASSGSLRLEIITSFQPVNGVVPQELVGVLTSPISGKGTVNFGNATIYQMNGFPISSGEANERRIVSSVSFRLLAEGWEFQNTCKYANKEIGSFDVISNGGFGSIRISNSVSNSDTRNPKFVWYKSAGGNFDLNSWIRTRYVPLDVSGKYIDRLHDEVFNGIKLVESCFTYGLKTDCSCKPLVSKYIVFCKPPDFEAKYDETSCGRTVVVSIGKTCHANKNKIFELLVNGTVVWSGGLWTGGHNMPYTNEAGITSVTFRMLCNGGYECVKTKTFEPPKVPNVIPDVNCPPGFEGKKMDFTFWKGKYNPTFINVEFLAVDGASVELLTDDAEKIVFRGEPDRPYTYRVYFPCGSTPIIPIKKNCCESHEPTITGDPCSGSRFWSNLKDGVSYKVGQTGSSVYPITKSQLALMDLNKEFTFIPTGQSATVKIQPGSALRWDMTGCVGNTLYSSKCGGLTFDPDRTTKTTAKIAIKKRTIYPPDQPGDTYQLKVNSGPFTAYVPDTEFDGIFGINTITLRRDNVEETRTLEIRQSADCQITEAEVVVKQNLNKYEVYLPDTECPCAEVVATPFVIKKITKIGTFFRVEFYSIFQDVEALATFFDVGSGANPLIKEGTITIQSPGFSESMPVSNTSGVAGYVDIPCKSNVQDPIYMSYNLKRLTYHPEGTPNPDKNISVVLDIGWNETVLGTGISGIRVVSSNGDDLQGIYNGATSYVFFPLDLTGGVNLKFVVSLNDGTSFEINAYDVLNPTGDDVLFVYGDNEFVCGNCLPYVTISFVGELNNGCKYESGSAYHDFAVNYCHGEEEIILHNAYMYNPIGGGKPYVNFYEDGVFIKRQHIESAGVPAVLDGTLPANPDGIEYGRVYSAEVKCGCFSETTLPCLVPVFTSGITYCNAGGYYSDGSSILDLFYSLTTAYPGRSVNIYNNLGVLLDTATTDANGQILDRIVTLTEAQAGLDDNLIIYAQIDSSCKSIYKLIPRAEVNLTWTEDCTNSPISYDLIFTGSPVLEIVSGTGTIVGTTIVNIPNNTTIVFKGTIGTCSSKEYTVLRDCTIEPSPSISISATRSVPYTPSVTKSISRSISISPSKFSGVLYSKTPSVTRSVTKSITPSISKSSTTGVSKSVSRSISITKSITPSISISPSEGVSISVTPSTTIIPVSPTKSVTPSTSAPCDGNCANYPGFEGVLCGGLGSYCCNGVSYDPLVQMCCSGTVIYPGDENNCGGCGYECPPGATCVNGVCNVSLPLSTISIVDGPCLISGNLGYCVNQGSIGTEIPNAATDVAIVSYIMSYQFGGQAGGTVSTDVTSSAQISLSAGSPGKTKVTVVSQFDAFRVAMNAIESNIVVISYKIGNVSYRGSFSGGASVTSDWNSGGQPTCGSACDWLG